MWSWPCLNYYPSICLVWLSNHTENRNQDTRFLGRDFNAESGECKASELPISPLRFMLANIVVDVEENQEVYK
jgi:hypothetical protein